MDGQGISRRTFIRTAAVAAGFAAVAGPTPARCQERTLPKRRMAGTELDVSVLGYGTEFMQDRAVADHLVSFGVNHIDTAPVYQEGEAERRLVPVIRDHGDSLVLTTKWGHHSDLAAPKDEFLASFAASCERMETDHVDIMYVHDARTPEKAAFASPYEAFRELRDAGKIGYYGLSTHLGQEATVLKCIELGWYSVLMVAWNFFSPPSLTDALKRAADNGMGIVVIKALKGLSEGQDWFQRATPEQRAVLDTFEGSMYQRAIRWTLSHDFVSSIIMSVSNLDQVEENVVGGFEASRVGDARQLRRYARAVSNQVCRGCATCLGACPVGVAVPDILRYRAYHRAYGEAHTARRLYADLPESMRANACTGCGICAAHCPYGLAVPELIAEAHRLLA
ncbi:MAG TPA: aldo/keto reductase [Armatimonadota bacterium]|nr:aldo/keto reductase [Armatimonadota bacterium]